jgi:fumarate reductase iron-sulfur subunit
MVLRVARWAPGARARQQDYPIEAQPGMTVLDALVELQRATDPTLAFRYACRVGMCGSCGMVIDGRERWACRTLLASLRGPTVAVRPLYHFPLIRDLVVDMAPFRDRMLAAGATFVTAAPGVPAAAGVPAGADIEPARIPRDSPERLAIDPAIECIGCGMCVSACTMVAHDPDFPGPAALNRAFTLDLDRRDGARGERRALLLGADALSRCHTQGNCTAVCPMEIPVTESILALRRRSVRSAR